MGKVSIITPWKDAPELIPTYSRSTQGAQRVIIDNGSEEDTALTLSLLADVYIRNEENVPFGVANNQGLIQAAGDVILFLNNDIDAPPDFVPAVAADVVEDGILYGPKKGAKRIAGVVAEYIEGFCIAATRATWDALGGWAEFPGNYWEDNELCYRAVNEYGMRLRVTNWNVWHYGNYTSSSTPGAYDHSKANYERLVKVVQNAA